jgi:hypothetical protein
VSYKQEGLDPRGRILRQSHHPDGTSRLVLDNGVTDTITIVTYSELLPGLLAHDMRDIRAHLMTRAPGHFRAKR